MRFLVTAGNTRERIDAVRDWGNIFTGNTGLAIARALRAIGEVDLLTSNGAHRAQIAASGDEGLRGIGFSDHADLRGKLAGLMKTRGYDGVFMAAAVSDYRPAGAYRIVSREKRNDGREAWVVEDVQAGKVSGSYEEIAVAGERTEKIIDLFRGDWGYRGLLVKFKLEVGRTREELVAIGRASRLVSGADYLVANTLDMVDGEAAGAYLIGATGEIWVAREQLADRLVDVVRGN